MPSHRTGIKRTRQLPRHIRTNLSAPGLRRETGAYPCAMLAHGACRQGFEVWFAITHRMPCRIHGGRADSSPDKRLQTCLRLDLFVPDDFGLKPLQPLPGENLHHVIRERCDTGGILFSGNRAPAKRPDLFGDPLVTPPRLDRLTHSAHVVITTDANLRARDRPHLLQVASFASAVRPPAASEASRFRTTRDGCHNIDERSCNPHCTLSHAR